jgi:myo-inositol-1(or 4)-monophosphatase
MKKTTTPSEALNFALKLSYECGDILQKYSKLLYKKPLKLINKGSLGLASEADLAAEKWAIKKIHERFPSHKILAEEQSFKGIEPKTSKDDYLWLIDPLDGTTNFLQGLPFYCVSLALMKGDKILAGVIYAPDLGQTFYASLNQGAWMLKNFGKQSTKRPLNLSRPKPMPFKDSLISTNLGSARHNASLIREFPEVKAFRRLGSAALELAYVAGGILDAYWEYQLKPWDTAAGGLIALEAGAILTDLSGQEFSPFKPGVLCARPELHPPLLKILL